MAELTLRSGTDYNLAHINIGRLLDRERNSAGDRLRRHGELVPGLFELGFHLRICHSFREVRVDEARRNDRHAQLVAGFLPQTFGDGAHGELRGRIDRLVRFSDKSCRRSSVNEMSKTLLAEDRQRGGDAVEHTFDVDVDHLLPILNAQVVERGNWHNAGIVEENVKFAVLLTCQLNEVGYLPTPFYVCACIGCLSTRSRDTASEGLKAIQSARAEHDLGTALGR